MPFASPYRDDHVWTGTDLTAQYDQHVSYKQRTIHQPPYVVLIIEFRYVTYVLLAFPTRKSLLSAAFASAWRSCTIWSSDMLSFFSVSSDVIATTLLELCPIVSLILEEIARIKLFLEDSDQRLNLCMAIYEPVLQVHPF